MKRIKPDTLKETISATNPLFLAYVHQGTEYMEHSRILEKLSHHFGDVLDMYFIDQEIPSSLKEQYNIEGSPTFLMFRHGCEKGRILGYTDNISLSRLIKNAIGDLLDERK